MPIRRDVDTPQPEVKAEQTKDVVKTFFIDSGTEINLGDDLDNLSEYLDFALPLFYRKHGSRTGRKERAEHFLKGDCRKATHDFGVQLSTEDEDGQTLFSEFSGARYFDVQGDNTGKYGDYHSIGMIGIPKTDKSGFHFIAIDLTHSAPDIGGDLSRAAVFVSDNESELKTTLSKYYGGKNWKAQKVFIPERLTQENMQPWLAIMDNTATDIMFDGGKETM